MSEMSETIHDDLVEQVDEKTEIVEDTGCDQLRETMKEEEDVIHESDDIVNEQPMIEQRRTRNVQIGGVVGDHRWRRSQYGIGMSLSQGSVGSGPSTLFGVAKPRQFRYPLIYVTPTGTISALMRDDVIVEIALDKALRVLCSGKFAVATNGRGTASCIMHPQARIYQQDTKVYSQFGNDKVAVFGSQGILFTMRPLKEAYLVSSSTIRGTTAIPLDLLQFPTLDSDFSLTLFYLQSQMGEQVVSLCEEIVRNAHYEIKEDGLISVNMNGVYIRQDQQGNVEVNSRPRHIRVSPKQNIVQVRTHFVDMGVQEDDKSFVKRGVKRIHVSRSGLVVSDGNCITSMDHYGRIVSST